MARSGVVSRSPSPWSSGDLVGRRKGRPEGLLGSPFCFLRSSSSFEKSRFDLVDRSSSLSDPSRCQSVMLTERDLARLSDRRHSRADVRPFLPWYGARPSSDPASRPWSGGSRPRSGFRPVRF